MLRVCWARAVECCRRIEVENRVVIQEAGDFIGTEVVTAGSGYSDFGAGLIPSGLVEKAEEPGRGRPGSGLSGGTHRRQCMPGESARLDHASAWPYSRPLIIPGIGIG